MQGFVISTTAPRFEEAIKRLAQWFRDDDCAYSEDILEASTSAGSLAGLYRGENTGKRLIRIRDSRKQKLHNPYAMTPNPGPPVYNSSSTRRFLRFISHGVWMSPMNTASS